MVIEQDTKVIRYLKQSMITVKKLENAGDSETMPCAPPHTHTQKKLLHHSLKCEEDAQADSQLIDCYTESWTKNSFMFTYLNENDIIT